MNFTAYIAFLQNLSTPEVILILLVFLLLFGAKKLPDFSRALGKSIGEFKRGRQELDEELTKAEVDESAKEKEKSAG